MSDIYLYASGDVSYALKCAWGAVLEYKGKTSETYYKVIKGCLSNDELEICAILHGMGKVKNKTIPLKIVTTSKPLIKWQRKINLSNKSLAYKDTRQEFQLHGDLYKYRDWLLDKMGQFNDVKVVSWDDLTLPHLSKDSILQDIYDIYAGG
jgi:ribonuclease HI